MRSPSLTPELQAVVWIACVSAAGCSDAKSTAPAWEAPPMRHGDSCADCHEDYVEAWSRTGMARALGPAYPDELEGLAPVEESATGFQYSFERTDQGAGSQLAIVERHARTEHRLEAEIAFAIGAGILDRSYAAAHGDLLWFAPLEVVSTDAGRHAALAPGHMIHPGSRFDVEITPECLGCHTDAPPPPASPHNLRALEEVWQPRGISCAACHGSVDAHVEWQGAALGGESPAGEDPILAPRAMTRVQRLSICASCHLQGDARIVLDPGQLGPPPPGGDLLERRALFVAAQPTQDIGFVSQVERLVLSRCFTQSQMVCETCHDPHYSMYEEAERASVRDACSRCHADDGGHSERKSLPCSRADRNADAGRDCVSCHMRETGVFDVADVRIHDHFIRTDPGAPSARVPLRVPEEPTGDWKRFAWPDEPVPDHIDDPGLWMMAWYRGGHFERAQPMIDRAPHARVAGLPSYHHVRGALLERAGQGEDAVAAYRRALELDANAYPSAVNLGILLGRLGRPQEGLEVLNELLQRHPTVEGALRNRALLHNQLGDYTSMARDLEAAFRIVPRAAVANGLAAYFGRAGDPARAAQWRAQSERLDPLPR